MLRVPECLAILSLQYFESIVRLNVCLLLPDIRFSLVDLVTLLFIEHKLLLLFLLYGDEQLLFIDLAVQSESGTFIDFHHAIVLLVISRTAECREGI